MLNRFESFFNRYARRVEPLLGRKGEPTLLDDDLLEELLAPLQELPLQESYPLQVGFYDKLLAYDLLLPIPVGSTLSKGRGVPIVTLENMKGERGLPIFTSEKMLSLWADESTNYAAFSFATLCGYAMEANVDYVIINVSGTYGCEISFHDFSYLAEGLLPPPPPEQSGYSERKPGEVLIQKDTPMRLGKSSGLPDGMMDRLRHVFHSHPSLISRVYLFEVGFNEGPLQPALGVRMPDGTESAWEAEIWPTMQAVLYEMLEKRTVINVFLLNQSGMMETHVKEITAPIYISGAGEACSP